MKSLKYLTLLLLFAAASYGQDTAKVMAYNLLNYVAGDTAVRNPYYRTTINAFNPDVMVVEEMTSQAMANAFRDKVLNLAGVGVYQSGTFIDGPDTDCEIYFKSNKFVFISNTPIVTDLRNIYMFRIFHIATQDTLILFAVHLKASTGAANELSRAQEVDSLRKVTNLLPAGSNFIVMGDFNIYGSAESAYQKLLAPGGIQGYFLDVLSLSGIWNNGAYAPYHTQSTRTRSFGGGATGGMDDRFDMILFSQGVIDQGGVTYIPQSLSAYGNDGQHYNDSINHPPNLAVSQTVANALHYSSDHLPITMKLKFESPNGIISISGVPAEFMLSQNYPNPFNPTTKIRFGIPAGLTGGAHAQIIIYDINGRAAAKIIDKQMQPGQYEVEWNAASYASGVYFYRLTAGEYVMSRKMILVK